MAKNIIWFAVQRTSEDAWDYGSSDLEEAKRMLLEQGEGEIAVIDAEDAFCEEAVGIDDLDWLQIGYWVDATMDKGFTLYRIATYKGNRITPNEEVLTADWTDAGIEDNDEWYQDKLDKYFQKELGFLPDYEIN